MFDSYLANTGTIIYPEEIANTLPYKLTGAASAVDYQGEIHLLGGSSDANHTGSVTGTYHYAWNGTSWRSVSSIPYQAYKTRAVVYNGKIHLLGSGNQQTKSKHYIWDGTSWEENTNTPRPGVDQYSSVFVYDNKIHALCYGDKNGYHLSFDGENWEYETSVPANETSSSNKYSNIVCFPYNGKIRCISYDLKYYTYEGGEWVYEKTLPGKDWSWRNQSSIVGYNGVVYFFKNTEYGSSQIFDGDSVYDASWDADLESEFDYHPEWSVPVIYNGKIHLLGGTDLSNSLGTITRSRAHMVFDGDTFGGVVNIFFKTTKS